MADPMLMRLFVLSSQLVSLVKDMSDALPSDQPDPFADRAGNLVSSYEDLEAFMEDRHSRGVVQFPAPSTLQRVPPHPSEVIDLGIETDRGPSSPVRRRDSPEAVSAPATVVAPVVASTIVISDSEEEEDEEDEELEELEEEDVNDEETQNVNRAPAVVVDPDTEPKAESSAATPAPAPRTRTPHSESLASPSPHELTRFRISPGLLIRLESFLRTTFGLFQFRPPQLRIICEGLGLVGDSSSPGSFPPPDVFVQLPTGYGKSLIFQVMALFGADEESEESEESEGEKAAADADAGKRDAAEDVGTGPGSSNMCLTIVVVPLISLMIDQVWGLRRRPGIPEGVVDYLSSGIASPPAGAGPGAGAGAGSPSESSVSPSAHTDSVMRRLRQRDPTLRLLYVTPEKLVQSRVFGDVLSQIAAEGGIRRFVIDECHCVSTWGHDFRPDYRGIADILRGEDAPEHLKRIPMTCCTGTATPRVVHDLISLFRMQEAPRTCRIIRTTLNRPNLVYDVEAKTRNSNSTAHAASMVEYLRARSLFQPSRERNRAWKIRARVPFKESDLGESDDDFCAPGIVYCLSRRDTEELSTELHSMGIRCTYYHAGLSPAERRTVHWSWSRGDMPVIVATTAFGMGIDKPDVRFVIHQTMPKTIEDYYQQSGRAGRDGKKSYCCLFYCFHDRFRLARILNRPQEIPAMNLMSQYCESKLHCRRNMQLRHFGETHENTKCGYCDNCRSQLWKEHIDRVGIGNSGVSQAQLRVLQRKWKPSEVRDMSFEAENLLSLLREIQGMILKEFGGDLDPGDSRNASSSSLRLFALGGMLKCFKGSRSEGCVPFSRLPHFRKGENVHTFYAELLAKHLILEGYIEEILDRTVLRLRCSPRGLRFLEARATQEEGEDVPRIELALWDDLIPHRTGQKRSRENSNSSDGEVIDLTSDQDEPSPKRTKTTE